MRGRAYRYVKQPRPGDEGAEEALQFEGRLGGRREVPSITSWLLTFARESYRANGAYSTGTATSSFRARK
jgi:hypothetical protein